MVENNNKILKNNIKPMMTLSFWQKIKTIIDNPGSFFDQIQSETNLAELIIYYILLQLIVLPFGIVASYFIGNESIPLTILYYIGGVFAGALIFLLILVIYQYIIHKMGGQQGFTRTAQSFVYGATPGILLSWLPIANILASIYSVYITIIGLMKLQQMPRNRAIWAYFLPFIIIIVIALLIVLFAFIYG